MEQELDSYFNFILRNRLSISEYFKIYHDKLNNNFIISPNRISKLFELLKINQELRTELKGKIISHLEKLYPMVKNISILINENNDKMTVEYHIREQTDIGFEDIGNRSDIGIYANVISRIPYEGIGNLCLSTKELSNACKNNNLWIEVIKIKFPDYLTNNKKEYKWRKIYEGLLYFKNLENQKKKGDYKFIRRVSGKIINYSWAEFIRDHAETLEYLVYNKLGNLNDNDIYNIINEISARYPDKFENLIWYILNNYNISLQWIKNIIDLLLDTLNIPLMEKAIEYSIKYNINYKEYTNEILDNIIQDQSYSDVDPKMLVYVSNKLGIELTPNYVLDKLLEVNRDSQKLIDKMIELLPNNLINYKDHIHSIVNVMIEDVYVYSYTIPRLYEKIKKVFTQEDVQMIINDLSEMEVNKDEQETVDELIEFFKRKL